MKYLFSWFGGIAFLLFCIDGVGTYFRVSEHRILIALTFSVLGIVPRMVGLFSKPMQKTILIVMASTVACSLIINSIITAIEKLPISSMQILIGDTEKGAFYTLSFFIIVIFVFTGTIWQYRTDTFKRI